MTGDSVCRKELPQKKVSCVVPGPWNLPSVALPASLHIIMYYKDESCLKKAVILNCISTWIVFYWKIRRKNWLMCPSSPKGKYPLNVPTSCFCCHRQAAQLSPDWGPELRDAGNPCGAAKDAGEKGKEFLLLSSTDVWAVDPPSCNSKSTPALWGSWGN